MKTTLRGGHEWSDFSESSPRLLGDRLPDAVQVGDEVVELSGCGYDLPESKAGYQKIHPDVRLKYRSGGDNYARDYGRRWWRLDLISPAGSRFLYRCRACDALGPSPDECECDRDPDEEIHWTELPADAPI